MPTIFDASAQKQAKEADRLAGELQEIVQQEQKKKKQASSKKSAPTQPTSKHSTRNESHPLQSSQSPDPELNSDFPTQTPQSSTTPTNRTEQNTQNTQNTQKETPMHTKGEKRKPADYSEVLRHEKPSNGAFSAFFTMPWNVEFESQHPQEQILMVLRQHPVVILPSIFIGLVLILAPFLIFPILPFFQFLPAQYGFFTMVAWYLFVAIYFFELFLSWYFNLYVITDERIIDIDFYSLVYKSVSEAKIERIEDVTATSGGFFAAVFNYGTITIQTAAEKREFEFKHVPQPAKVSKFLNELILEEERERVEGRVM